MPNTMFPIFLKMDQIQTLVVGGGNVALEKASAILRNSPEANLTLVAPFFRPETLEYLQDFPQVRIIERGFQASDLVGLDLIICATDSSELHAEIKALAAAQHLLCNVADTPPLCDFYLGSIVQKGDLKISPVQPIRRTLKLAEQAQSLRRPLIRYLFIGTSASTRCLASDQI